MAWDDLPEGWELTSLADIAQDVQTGFACSARDEEGLPHLRPNNISRDGKLDLGLVKRVPFEAGDLSRYDLKPEDVLFNNTNSQELVGKTAIFDLEGTYSFSNHLTRIRVRPDLLIAEWLSFWFQHLWHIHHFERICNRWIGQAGINTKKLSDVEVPVPPLPEQRRIVARIEELTERIDAARRLRAEAAEEAAAILPSALAEVFGEAEAEGWEVKPMGEVGYWTSGGTPSRSQREYFDGNIPWVKTGDLNDDYLNQTKETISEEGLNNSSAKLFPKGTILVAMYGATIGKIAILNLEAATNQACAALQVNPDLLTNKWAFCYILSIRNHLRELGKGGAQPNISQTVLKAQNIPLPPLDEQRCIVEYLDAVQAKVEAIRRYQEETREEIEAMTGAVLERAFGGEL